MPPGRAGAARGCVLGQRYASLNDITSTPCVLASAPPIAPRRCVIVPRRVLNPLDGELELAALGRLRDRPTRAAADPVAQAQPGEALGKLLLIRLRRVRAASVELDVARVQPRIRLLEPGHHVVA